MCGSKNLTLHSLFFFFEVTVGVLHLQFQFFLSSSVFVFSIISYKIYFISRIC